MWRYIEFGIRFGWNLLKVFHRRSNDFVKSVIDLMHWRHVSITTTPCWGSRLVALRAHVLLAERIGAHPLSQCAHPGQLGGEACRGLPSECMLGDGARGVPRLTPNTTGAPFCDVICIWSILYNQALLKIKVLPSVVRRGKIHGGSGLWAILPPKCKQEPSGKKKKEHGEPLKITIDCNVKACSMLQIYSMGCEK